MIYLIAAIGSRKVEGEEERRYDVRYDNLCAKERGWAEEGKGGEIVAGDLILNRE